ncbi:MAG: hypothetical protein NTY03_01815 [Candidatus Bathyarchaeota archaeon]|nr:hypothetical protein [Candidatus Bathyarchaeota archaeon]
MDPGVKKKLTIDLQGVFKITDEIDDKSLGLDEVKKESLENASIAKAELNKYKGDSLKAEIIKNVLIKQGFCNPCNLKDRNNPLMCSVECKNKLWNKGFSKNRKKNQRGSQQ